MAQTSLVSQTAFWFILVLSVSIVYQVVELAEKHRFGRRIAGVLAPDTVEYSKFFFVSPSDICSL
jgi:hypothetical protein